uniref:Uncharacterized protein n=1 Tax=Trichinella nativa TaxID=6335 RepID=A0A0V1KIM3_9BILA
MIQPPPHLQLQLCCPLLDSLHLLLDFEYVFTTFNCITGGSDE